MLKNCSSIVLFRRDLRLLDNAALYNAHSQGKILPAYIHEANDDKEWHIGAASQWWLHHSLQTLSHQFEQQNHNLFIFKADTKNSIFEILCKLCQDNHCQHVFWNRRYEPTHIQQDTELKKQLTDAGITVHSFNNNLLSEPWQHLNKQGTPYKVFTPFWRHCKNGYLTDSPIPTPLPAPTLGQENSNWQTENQITLNELNLLPTKPNWAQGFESHWQVGEQAAQKNWDTFLTDNINQYDESRNIPSIAGTSKLSPHLAFGEISVRQIWHDVLQRQTHEGFSNVDLDRYLSEIGWREFSYYQLYHFPKLPTENFNPRFNNFRWNDETEGLQAWQQGLTGFPLVDAGMRELWQTGYMHNRVRMIVASFLCKDLMIHWQKGAQWFWDTLLDADLASNSASWQWCAGCGADAAPFFRIFNPTTQSEKFDTAGQYIRRWVPELSDLPDKHIHSPANAPATVLTDAKITLGKTYPYPLADHKAARLDALERYKDLKTIEI